MAIAIKSVTVGTNTGSTATVSVTTAETTATAVGDLVVVLHANDFYTLANMVTPTATGSPTITAIANGTADGGSNAAHIIGYTYVANTAGAQTISTTETGAHDEEKILVAYVLSGADTASPIDGGSSGAAGAASTTATPHPAPSVTPSGSDGLLICHANTGGGSSGGGSYTSVPSGMTSAYNSIVGSLTYAGATLQLVSSGATGTKNFTPASTAPYATLSVVIKTAPPTDPGYGYILQETGGNDRIQLEDVPGFLLIDTAAADPIPPDIVLAPRIPARRAQR